MATKKRRARRAGDEAVDPAARVTSAIDRVARSVALSAGAQELWSAEEIRVALRAEWEPLGAATKAASEFLAGDRRAGETLRRLLEDARGFEHDDTFVEAELEPAMDDHGLLAADALWQVTLACTLLSRSDEDRARWTRGIASLFERMEWIESLFAGALAAAKGGTELVPRLQQYADLHVFTPLAQRVEDHPVADARFARATLRSGRGGGGRGGRRPPRRPPRGERPDRRQPRQDRRPRRDRPDRPPRDWQSMERRQCWRRMQAAAARHEAWMEAHQPDSRLVWSDNIESLTPDKACAGVTMTITGHGFGDTPPDHVHVMMRGPDGCQALPPVAPAQWSDTAIEVVIPEWARVGCVGFIDESKIEEHRLFHTQMRQHRRDMSRSLGKCGVTGGGTGLKPFAIPCPPCTDMNQFGGTIPEIPSFIVDGSSDTVIEPDGTVELKWHVRAAEDIRLSRIGGSGPELDEVLVGTGDDFGTWTLTFAAIRDLDATYRLVAHNDCGDVQADVLVRVRRSTEVRVRGLEVVQAIQTFEMDDPESSNTVFLVEGKRTLVRAYVDSGYPSTYSPANGREGTLQLGIANGSLTVTRSDGVVVAQQVRPIRWAWASTPSTIDRLSLFDTLNFELPFAACEGTVRITVTVTPTDPHATWDPASASVDVIFNPSPPLDLIVLEVVDQHRANRGPTNDEIRDGLDQIEAVFPTAHGSQGTGLTLWSTGNDVIETDLDYDRDDAWFSSSPFETDLLDLVEEIAEEFDDFGQIWCAVIPPSAVTPGGRAGYGIGGNLIGHPRAAWTAESTMTAAHEVGHALWQDHAEHATGIVGVNVATRELFDEETLNLMNPDSGTRWIDFDQYASTYTEIFSMHGIALTWET